MRSQTRSFAHIEVRLEREAGDYVSDLYSRLLLPVCDALVGPEPLDGRALVSTATGAAPGKEIW